ncbi:MAG TPA: hypothetical protein VKU02_19870 [Gemmataceae bacterium]|nr:hypothetical protein [Gemmataceae bacterium]
MCKMLARGLYGLVGVLFLLAGIGVLLLGTGLLPSAVSDLIRGISQDNPHTLHVMQEFASLLIFAGLIALWFFWHYERSWPFHLALTIFWGLIALVHWFDIRGSFQLGVGPVINMVPLGLFVVVGLLRKRSERWSKPAWKNDTGSRPEDSTPAAT